jgi:hypothetical protein
MCNKREQGAKQSILYLRNKVRQNDILEAKDNQKPKNV